MRAVGRRRLRWRQPEYTGANRCLPCTVVNVALTALVAAGVGSVSAPLGVVVAALGVAAIYFRGYLVPGTPTLTKRYLPESVLELFDGHDAPEFALGAGASAVVDIERFLVDVGALDPCRGDEDLCLSPAFREAWYGRIDDRSADPADAVPALLEDVGRDRQVTTEQRQRAFVVMVDSAVVGRWESTAAFRADCAADAVLRDRSTTWATLTDETRLEVLGALRLWLDRCPDCGGPVSIDGETVESCCRSFKVVAATCDDCGTRVFEARLPAEELQLS
ncbi:hypothetical protein DVK02_12380 [Halobellus sp. Atlit-31R]|nr:hypothetical protein DVK02_12380 [Halobellus sp. Atlit-31R]